MNQRPMVQIVYVSLNLLGVVYVVEKQSVFGNYCKLIVSVILVAVGIAIIFVLFFSRQTYLNLTGGL